MNNNQLKQKADELWYLFENNIFDNKGNFSYNTNLVFAFADYIEELTNTDLSEFLQTLIVFTLNVIHGSTSFWKIAWRYKKKEVR